MTTEILREQHDGPVATLRLARPPVNAVSIGLLEALDAAFSRLATDPEVRVVVLTGEGDAFSAGADLPSAAQTGPMPLVEKGREVCPRIAAFPKPLVAAVNGICLGGGLEIALTADIRLAAQSARFGQPEVNLGIIPGWGGTQRLPAVIGLQRARELIYTGRLMGAEEALEAGLVLRVYPDDELRERALNLARGLAQKPPLALQGAKAALSTWAVEGHEAGYRREGEEMARLIPTEDAIEGVTAFLQKRRPRFRGR